jgi:hypothetical protein
MASSVSNLDAEDIIALEQNGRQIYHRSSSYIGSAGFLMSASAESPDPSGGRHLAEIVCPCTSVAGHSGRKRHMV